MSKGPGRIERAIRQLFDAHPDLAFVTDELVEYCYPDARPLERKHKVAVLRAAHKVIALDPDWQAWRWERHGRGWVFANHANVQSYAQGRQLCTSYAFDGCWSDRVTEECGSLIVKRHINRTGLTESLASKCREWMAGPDGVWFRAVQQHCAERDGDVDLVVSLKAKHDAEMAAWSGAIRKRFSAENAQPQGNAYAAVHLALADKAHALMTQNDPDAVRAGLAEIADALDQLGGSEAPMLDAAD